MITTVSSDIFYICGPFSANCISLFTYYIANSTPRGCKCDYKAKLCDPNNDKLENMLIIVQL